MKSKSPKTSNFPEMNDPKKPAKKARQDRALGFLEHVCILESCLQGLGVKVCFPGFTSWGIESLGDESDMKDTYSAFGNRGLSGLLRRVLERLRDHSHRGCTFRGSRLWRWRVFKVWMFQNFRKAFNLRFGDSGDRGGFQVSVQFFLLASEFPVFRSFTSFGVLRGLKLQIQLKHAVSQWSLQLL